MMALAAEQASNLDGDYLQQLEIHGGSGERIVNGTDNGAAPDPRSRLMLRALELDNRGSKALARCAAYWKSSVKATVDQKNEMEGCSLNYRGDPAIRDSVLEQLVGGLATGLQRRCPVG